MSKRREPEKSPAEDYLEQLNPDRSYPWERIYRRYSNTRIEDDDGHYHIQIKGPDDIPADPISRSINNFGKGASQFLLLLFGIGLVAAVYYLVRIALGPDHDGTALAILVIGGIFAAFVAAAIHDASRPARKNLDDEDKKDGE